MSDFRIGWHLFCIGEDFSLCTNDAQRRGWTRAFTQSEVNL